MGETKFKGERASLSPSAIRMCEQILKFFPDQEFSMAQLKSKLGNPPDFTMVFNELIGNKVSMSGTRDTGPQKSVVVFKLNK